MRQVLRNMSQLLMRASDVGRSSLVKTPTSDPARSRGSLAAGVGGAAGGRPSAPRAPASGAAPRPRGSDSKYELRTCAEQRQRPLMLHIRPSSCIQSQGWCTLKAMCCLS